MKHCAMVRAAVPAMICRNCNKQYHSYTVMHPMHAIHIICNQHSSGLTLHHAIYSCLVPFRKGTSQNQAQKKSTYCFSPKELLDTCMHCSNVEIQSTLSRNDQGSIQDPAGQRMARTVSESTTNGSAMLSARANMPCAAGTDARTSTAVRL